MSNTQQIINELNVTIGTFTGRVNAKLNEVDATSARIRQTADTTLNAINKFKKEMIENEQMQSAQENILRINQIIRERFYDYDTIRKTVMGVVKDFDINLVRNKTIEELSEELWITSSRYWLSYTLIALSAWVNDNKKLADNAVAESSRADGAKTSLFFCLTNLRFGRIDVARAWLSEYFRTLVPDDLQNEAAIVLQSYINGVFGIDERLRQEVQDVIDEWILTIKNNEELSEELVEMYRSYIKNLRPNNTFDSIYLKNYCLNYDELPHSYNEALKYKFLLNKIKEVDVENIVQNASNYKKRIDLILVDLITNYDEEEKELKEQQEYFQLVIDNKGNEEKAAQQFEQIMKVRYQKNNFGQKCIEWALYAKSDDINVHVRKFGFYNTKPWLLKALTEWSTEFEERFPLKYQLEIGIHEDRKWSCESNGEDEQEQIVNMTTHIEELKKKIVWDKKVKKRLVFGAIFLVLGILIMAIPQIKEMFGGGSFNLILGGIVAVLGLVFTILFLVRVLKGKSRYDKILNEAIGKLKGCFGELTEYRRVYFANLDIKYELISLIEHL